MVTKKERMQLPLTPSTRGKNTSYKLRLNNKHSWLPLCEYELSYLFRSSACSSQNISLNLSHIITTQSLSTSLVRFGIKIGNNWISECSALLLKWYTIETSIFLKMILLKKGWHLIIQIFTHITSIISKFNQFAIKWWVFFSNLWKNLISKPISLIGFVMISTVLSPLNSIVTNICKNLILRKREKWP